MARHLAPRSLAALLVAAASVVVSSATACRTARPAVVVSEAVFEGCYRAHFPEDKEPTDDGIYCPDKRAFFIEDPELSAREHAEEALLRIEVLAGLSQGELPLVALESPAGWRAAHPERGGVDVYELDTEGGDVALFCTWDDAENGWCQTLAMLLYSEGARGFEARTRKRPASPDVVLDRMRWRRQCAQGSEQACEAMRVSCRSPKLREGCVAGDVVDGHE